MLNSDDEKDDGANAFFSILYKNVDDDTRRAKMKSYVQYNGTILTTDWKEARGKNMKLLRQMEFKQITGRVRFGPYYENPTKIEPLKLLRMNIMRSNQ